MIIRSATLQGSAPDVESCPDSDLPEFAFIGRSNVGKSSLINMLTRKRGLARVSSTPGKTSLLHFFAINEQWTLVDLPGYGYAKVAKKDRKKFDALITGYLQNRQNLVCTFILLDVRLTPQEIDLTFVRWMVECGLPLVLVFTKADKVSKKVAQANVDEFLERMKEIAEESPLVLLTSSETGAGRTEMLGLIHSALTENPDA